jgi:hypothetical protein
MVIEGRKRRTPAAPAPAKEETKNHNEHNSDNGDASYDHNDCHLQHNQNMGKRARLGEL